MAQTLAPQQLLAHYRVTGALGTGGMGEVYLARDMTLDRNVALKILPPALVGDAQRLRRFVLEAKSASSLNHPNIVTIHEIGEAEARGANGRAPAGEAAGPLHFIAMEYVDGITLADAIHRDRTDVKTLVGYLAQAAEGLAKAHAAGIVHRDLKPGNIMVSKDGFAKVLDFGLAKLTERTCSGDETTVAPQTDLTGEGVAVGTTGYMSPEQVAGKTVDARSDIFSFGCILYEAAARQRAFVGETGIDTLHKILNDAPRPVEEINPRVPAELRRVVRRCLAKSPDQRYQSIKDVAIELREIEEAYDTLPISGASGSGGAPTVAPRPRRSRWITAGIAGAAVALGMIAMWVVLSRLGPAEPDAGADAEPLRITTILDRQDCLQPVLSPDARYLAYTTHAGNDYGIRVRQVATGSDVPVLEPQQGFVCCLSFTPDGDYVYFMKAEPGRGVATTLFAAPALGGTPRKILDNVFSSAAFAPDGRRFAFLRYASDSVMQIVVWDLASGSQRVAATLDGELLNVRETMAWSPDGREIRILFSRPRGIQHADTRAAAFDAETGARRELGTWDGLSPDEGAWLRENAIVVTGTEPSTPTLQLWKLEFPSGARRRITNDSSVYRFPSASADGAHVAAIRATNTWELWSVASAGGAEPRRVPLTVRRPDAPVARADGTLVFGLRHDDGDAIWTAGTDGSRLQRITPPGLSAQGFRLLPSSDVIVFDGARADQSSHIWRIDMDGTGLVQLTDGEGESLVAVSPDGRECLYSTTGKSTDVLWRLPLGEGGEATMIAAAHVGGAFYSPDGRFIAHPQPQFESGRWKVPIAIVGRDGGNTVAMVDLQDNSQTISWSSDGSALLHVRAEQGSEAVMRHPISGGAATPLFRLPKGVVGSLKWSPDRRTLLFAVFAERVWNLWTWTPGSASPRPLTRFPTGSIYFPSWAPDGTAVYFGQGYSTRDAVLIRGFK